MKKLFLAILFAAFFALGTAMAQGMNCVPVPEDQCAPNGCDEAPCFLDLNTNTYYNAYDPFTGNCIWKCGTSTGVITKNDNEKDSVTGSNDYIFTLYLEEGSATPFFVKLFTSWNPGSSNVVVDCGNGEVQNSNNPGQVPGKSGIYEYGNIIPDITGVYSRTTFAYSNSGPAKTCTVTVPHPNTDGIYYAWVVTNEGNGDVDEFGYMTIGDYVYFTNRGSFVLYDGSDAFSGQKGSILKGTTVIPNNTPVFLGTSSIKYALEITPKVNGPNQIDLVNFGIYQTSLGSGKYKVYDTGLSLPGSSTKKIFVPAGDVPYAYCCPTAESANAIIPTCSNVFVTYASENINSVNYYICSGMSGSGSANNGETNLTINDSAEGGSVAKGASVDFFAYFYNATVGVGDTSLNDTNANCTIYQDGANHTMTYDGTDARWEYTDSNGYATTGTKNWEVWCDTNATGHFNLHATDDLSVTDSGSVPEFSDFAWVLAAVLGAGGFILIRKYKHF